MGVCDSAHNKNYPNYKNSKNNNLKTKKQNLYHSSTLDNTNQENNNNFSRHKKCLTSRESNQFSDINKDLIINNDVIISNNSISPESIYKKIKIIGTGGFGEVWLVKNKNLNKNFAMKIIKKRKKSELDEKEILNEISILKSLDHPNILKILDFFNTNENFNIITEFCPDGELFAEITKVNRFQEGQAAFILSQILMAISYCHSKNIIHRDLKPENIMIVNREKNGGLQVKIIDFGNAKIFDKEHSENKYVGSSYYMAPEVIKRNYDEKCDLWSCGVILYILLTGKPPFDGIDDDEIVESVKEGEFDRESFPYISLSEEAKDLIDRLLTYDPSERISSEEALQHPWFKTSEFIKKNEINIIHPSLAKELIDNMSHYDSTNKLRCAVIAYLVHNNTNLEQCSEASKLFYNIDKDKNGTIEKEELIEGFEKYWNLKGNDIREKVDIIFDNIDTDHNGYIEYEEFIRAAVNPKIFISRNYLKFAFSYFDKDGSGDISFDEVKQRFMQNQENSHNEDIEKLLKKNFDQIDINKDGTLSFDEFCHMMKNIMK
jgi:calcium-dependent protein kinase